MEFCKEHTQVISALAEIKSDIKAVRNDLQLLNKRVNGSFERMAKHIEEGEYWRRRITAHEIKMKVLTWIFTSVNIGILFLLLKIVLKGTKINV